MRISDWSSDVCSSDLASDVDRLPELGELRERREVVEDSTLGVGGAAGADVREQRCLPIGVLRLLGTVAEAVASAMTATGRRERSIAHEAAQDDLQIGRASGRERVCQYV